MKIWNDILNLFFPPLCVVCDERLTESEEFLCVSCLSKLPIADVHNFCDSELEKLLAGRFPFHKAISFTVYQKEGMMQRIVHRFKYGDDSALAYFMGELCGTAFVGKNVVDDIDVLIPVPLHTRRMRERGYNQSEEIARGISSKLSIPVCADILCRKINNPPQAQTQSRMERWRNVKNIFHVEDETYLVGKHILLVDDVITTGSTLEACAKALLDVEGVRISVFALSAAQ